MACEECERVTRLNELLIQSLELANEGASLWNSLYTNLAEAVRAHQDKQEKEELDKKYSPYGVM